MDLRLETGIDIDALGRAAGGADGCDVIEQLLGIDRARHPHGFLVHGYDV